MTKLKRFYVVKEHKVVYRIKDRKGKQGDNAHPDDSAYAKGAWEEYHSRESAEEDAKKLNRECA